MYEINADGLVSESVKDNDGEVWQQRHEHFQLGKSISGSALGQIVALEMYLAF